MTTLPEIPQDIQDQLALYFDNQATPEVVAAIQAWLEQDPANPRLFAEYGSIERMIYEAQRKEDASAVFALLQEMEDKAEPDYSLLEIPASFTDEPHKDHTYSLAELLSLLAYAGTHALRTKAAAIASVAAVLVIGLVLYLAFAGPSTTPDAPQTADNPTTEQDPARPTDTPTVATLTAQHNAAWAPAGGASAPPANPSIGSKLHPNQRLTLTAGFAEITTNDGAVAILEAPATVELLDNNNAFRLHTGKLVGICETESSKGFVVRTQHMGVTDLGTRFGVEVTHEGTRAHVFEGDIAVHAPDALDFDQATRLGVGESAITEAGKSIVITTTRPGLTFVRDWAAATNAPRVTGPIRYTASVPTALDFDQREADDHILLLSEQKGLRLSMDIPVSKAELLDGHRFRADSKVPVGTVVDTYLLHGDIVGDDPDKGINFRGSIRFDRPILGVIANGIDLSRSHRALGLKGVTYPGMQVTSIVAENAGLEKSFEDKTVDGFVISEDRRTLSVAFDTGGSVDQLRVLVLADEKKPTN